VHHRTTLSGYLRNYGTCRQLKNLLNSNISSTCPHFGPLTADIGWRVWAPHPSKFQLVSRHGFVSAPTSLNRRQPNFARYLAVFWAGTLTEFCHMQNSLCVQVLRSPILAALLRGTRAVIVSQSLWRGTRNGITELSLLVILNRGHHLYSEGGHHVGHRPTF